MGNEVDFKSLLSRTMDDRELAVEILESFIEESKGCIDSIKSAIKSRDYTELRDRAHELKGASGSASVNNVYSICQDIQLSLDNNNREDIEEKVANLEKHFILSVSEIREII